MTSRESGIARWSGPWNCHAVKREPGVTEISRLLGLHKSTVQRSLNTLERRGSVAESQTTSR